MSTKVISHKSISFPKFAWGISAGVERELPENKEHQDAILSHPDIELVGAPKAQKKVEES